MKYHLNYSFTLHQRRAQNYLGRIKSQHASSVLAFAVHRHIYQIKILSFQRKKYYFMVAIIENYIHTIHT
jgi:hypothetical protein